MRTLYRAGTLFIIVIAATPACATSPAQLTSLIEARRFASELQVEFTKASDAANRAVMANSSEAASPAVDEAKRARQVVEHHATALRTMLESLRYEDDIRYLDGFTSRFEEYKRLDDEILSLAVESTNVKAQRLSFGAAQQAADAFRQTLDAAVHSRATGDACQIERLASQAHNAVLEIQVMQAPHIAEPDDAVMTRMEGQVAASASAARKALDRLKPSLTGTAAPHLEEAGVALDRFLEINREIVVLSRRNSNVRSLALTFGRKRVVAAECADQLRSLDAALAKHEFSATR
jgi:MinD-like ATPase involved in chromosome partitioning or flagellar assembly